MNPLLSKQERLLLSPQFKEIHWGEESRQPHVWFSSLAIKLTTAVQSNLFGTFANTQETIKIGLLETSHNCQEFLAKICNLKKKHVEEPKICQGTKPAICTIYFIYSKC